MLAIAEDHRGFGEVAAVHHVPRCESVTQIVKTEIAKFPLDVTERSALATAPSSGAARASYEYSASSVSKVGDIA